MWRAIFLSAVLIGTAHADDPFACVDPDVANAFLGNPYGSSGAYSTEFPDDFVELNVPTEFHLVGSQSLDTHASVVFKSNQPETKALRDIVGAMEEIGWTDETNRLQRVAGGFQAPLSPSFATICHNENRESLGIWAAENAGVSFVSLVRYAEQGSCGFGDSPRASHDLRGIRAYIPIMTMPDGAEATDVGGGGSGFEMNSRAEVSTSLSRSDLASFFDNQIREQGWEPQTTWSSSYSTGSVWARKTEEFGLLIGTLHLTEPDSGPVRVRFEVAPAAAPAARGSSNWSLASG